MEFLNAESEIIYDMIEDKLRSEGYKNLSDIRFSLSYCQGDGIAFYGRVHKSVIELEEYGLDYITELLEYAKAYLRMGKEDLKGEYNVYFSVKKDKNYHMYNHYNTMNVTEGDYVDLEDFVYDVVLDILDSGEVRRRLERILYDDKEIEEVMEILEEPYYSPEDDLVCYIMKGIRKEPVHKYIEDELIKLSKELEKEAYEYMEQQED